MAENPDRASERKRKALLVLAEAMADPLRGRILDLLILRSDLSVKEISQALDEPQRRVRYHVDRLAKNGLVDMTAETTLRGTRQRRYRAHRLAWISADEARMVPDEQMREISFQVFKRTLSDVKGAVDEGTFGIGRGHFEARIGGAVDQRGLDELLDVFERALSEAQGIIHASAIRTPQAPLTDVSGALFLFENRKADTENPGDT